MSDAFTGEIRIFGGNFTPQDWARCHGQKVTIGQYNMLYAVLGIMYGGDGRTVFNLPNLQNRTVCGVGTGTNLTPRVQGWSVGEMCVTLTDQDLPSHTHGAVAVDTEATLQAPGRTSVLAKSMYMKGTRAKVNPCYTDAKTPIQKMSPTQIGPNNAYPDSHENCQPWLAMNFIICLNGIWPARPS